MLASSSQRNHIIEHLITSVAKLPGLGPRSARRIVLHLLRKKDSVMDPLIQQLLNVSQQVNSCNLCRNLDTQNPCHICTDSLRDHSILCVVEDVADLWAMERAKLFRGQYFVLGGVLSAIDGIGPEKLGIPLLMERIQQGFFQEVILATNATADGQTTAHYLMEQLEPLSIKITKLAQGIPIGAELDYLDDGTLGAALNARLAI